MESRMTNDEDGTKTWRNQEGELHREDGPAVIWPEGSEMWYQNGQLHRDNGPAVIWADGDQCWYQNGQRHRTDGPAVIWPDGEKEWYLNGIPLSFTEWVDELHLDQKTRLGMVLKWNLP